MTLRVFFWSRLPIFDAGSSRLVATPMGCMTVSTVESCVYIMLAASPWVVERLRPISLNPKVSWRRPAPSSIFV